MKFDIMYSLVSYRDNTVKKIGFVIDDEIDHVVNAVNIFKTLVDKKLDYLCFKDFMIMLNVKDKEEFYSNIFGSCRNLVNLPLGYDGTSHSVHFITVMHYNFDIEIVDLSNKHGFDPIIGYEIDAKLCLSYPNIYDNPKSDIASFVYVNNDLKHQNLKNVKLPDGSYDMEKFKEFCDLMDEERNKFEKFFETAGNEFEYIGHKFKMNIIITQPSHLLEFLGE